MPDGNFVDLAAHFRAARLIDPPAYRRDRSIHYGVRLPSFTLPSMATTSSCTRP